MKQPSDEIGRIERSFDIDNTLDEIRVLLRDYKIYRHFPEEIDNEVVKKDGFLCNITDRFIGFINSMSLEEIRDNRYSIDGIRNDIDNFLVTDATRSLLNYQNYDSKRTRDDIKRILDLNDDQNFQENAGFMSKNNKFTIRVDIDNILDRCFEKITVDSLLDISYVQQFMDCLKDVKESVPDDVVHLSTKDIVGYIGIDSFEYIEPHFVAGDKDRDILFQIYDAYEQSMDMDGSSPNDGTVHVHDLRAVFDAIEKAVLIAGIKNQIYHEDAIRRYCSRKKRDFDEVIKEVGIAYSKNPGPALSTMRQIPSYVESKFNFKGENLEQIYDRYIEYISEGLEYNLDNIGCLEEAVSLNNRHFPQSNYKPPEKTISSLVKHYFDNSISKIEKLYASSINDKKEKKEISRIFTNLLDATEVLAGYIEPNRNEIKSRMDTLKNSITEKSHLVEADLKDEYLQGMSRVKASYKTTSALLDSLNQRL